MPYYEQLEATRSPLPQFLVSAFGLTPGRSPWGLEPWDLGDLKPGWLEYVEIERPWFYALPRARYAWDDAAGQHLGLGWTDAFTDIIFVGAALQLGEHPAPPRRPPASPRLGGSRTRAAGSRS